MLTDDGTYANFTMTGFSGYAVSVIPVPEPTAITLLVLGLAGATAYAWHRQP